MADKYKDGTYEIVGAAFRVHSALGSGLREKPYENALVIELKKTFRVDQQRPYPILYENKVVGDCIPDITVDERILVDTKSVTSIGDNEVAQMLNYLRISHLKVGLIINFQNASLEWRRVVR